MKEYQSLGKELYPGPFQAIPMLSCAFIVTPTLTTKADPKRLGPIEYHIHPFGFFFTIKGFMKQKIKITN